MDFTACVQQFGIGAEVFQAGIASIVCGHSMGCAQQTLELCVWNPGGYEDATGPRATRNIADPLHVWDGVKFWLLQAPKCFTVAIFPPTSIMWPPWSHRRQGSRLTCSHTFLQGPLHPHRMRVLVLGQIASRSVTKSASAECTFPVTHPASRSLFSCLPLLLAQRPKAWVSTAWALSRVVTSPSPRGFCMLCVCARLYLKCFPRRLHGLAIWEVFRVLSDQGHSSDVRGCATLCHSLVE